MSLAVVILTYNEALHIARAIQSIKSVASEILVIDSWSTDDTAEIAKANGAVVMQHDFVNQAKQFQWALDTAPITAAWVMRLDADEVIGADLVEEIARSLPQLPPDVTGVVLNRKHIFLGRWIRHGGRYPLRLLRIWRRDQATVEDRWMDEHIFVKSGRTVEFAGDFSDINLNDLTSFVDKHNRYATREAVQVVLQRRGQAVENNAPRAGTVRQARLKRMLKTAIYERMPFQLSATGYFLYRYVVRLGFLDGREGLIYHVLQGFWYRFLVGAKVLELERALQAVKNPAEVKPLLSKLTGLKIG